jgi:hypothetical protein
MAKLSIRPLQQKTLAVQKHLLSKLRKEPAKETNLEDLIKQASIALASYNKNKKETGAAHVAGEVEFLESIPMLAAAFDLATEQKLIKTPAKSNLVNLCSKLRINNTGGQVLRHSILLNIELSKLHSQNRSGTAITTSSTAREIKAHASKLEKILAKSNYDELSRYAIAHSLKNAIEPLQSDAHTMSEANKESRARIGGKTFSQSANYLRSLYALSSIQVKAASHPLFDSPTKQVNDRVDDAFSAAGFLESDSFIANKRAQQQAINKERGDLYDHLFHTLRSHIETCLSIQSQAPREKAEAIIITGFKNSLSSIPPFQMASLIEGIEATLEYFSDSTTTYAELKYSADILAQSLSADLTSKESKTRTEAFTNSLIESSFTVLNSGDKATPTQYYNIEQALQFIDSFYKESPLPGAAVALKSQLESVKQKAPDSKAPSEAHQAESERHSVQLDMETSGSRNNIDDALDLDIDHDATNNREPTAVEYSSEITSIEEILDVMEMPQHEPEEATQEDSSTTNTLSKQSANEQIQVLMEELKAERMARELAEEQVRSRRAPLTTYTGDKLVIETRKRLETLCALYKAYDSENQSLSIGNTAELVDLELDIGAALYKKPEIIFAQGINQRLGESVSLYDELSSRKATLKDHLEHSIIRERFDSGLKASDFSLASPLNISPFDICESAEEIDRGEATSAQVRSLASYIVEKTNKPTIRTIDKDEAFYQAERVRSFLVDKCLSLLQKAVLEMDLPSQQTGRNTTHLLSRLPTSIRAASPDDNNPIVDRIEEITRRFIERIPRHETENVSELRSASGGPTR